MRFAIILTLALLTNLGSFAQYSIKGKVNFSEGWQPRVYLAEIHKLSDYYRMSPDMIMNSAPIAEDGTFEIYGEEIPLDKHFYRLYLMKDENTEFDAALYVGGDDHNFAHIVLGNGDEIELFADVSSPAPFGSYVLKGSPENEEMHRLSDIVIPHFYNHQMQFQTEAKLYKDEFEASMKEFALNAEYPLVALAAVINMDFDEYFEEDEAFFTDFAVTLKTELPMSEYTKNYMLKLDYYGSLDSTSNATILNWLLAPALLIALIALVMLKRELSVLQSSVLEKSI